jgi:hypothetical protein
VVCLGLAGVSAFADDGGSFETKIVGSTPGEHVAGIASAGAPWKVANGEATISNGGRINVEIRGLLLSAGASINTVGPITMVMASVACGDVVVASTAPVLLTSTGNAAFHDSITLPSPCIAPAVLIRIAATTTGPVANGQFIAINAL